MTTTLPDVTQAESTYYPALPIECLRESKDNPRRHFNDATLAELAESLKAHGQLNACLGRPTGQTRIIDGEEWPIVELAAGHRRYRAAKRAKLTALAVVARPMTDAQYLEVLNLENLHRDDLHPLDEALGYRRLLELPGYDIDVLAGKVGKSTSYVYQRLKLAELTPAAQKAFLADEITAGHAILIARLQPKEQDLALKEALNAGAWDGRPSVRQLGVWIQRFVLCALDSAAFPKADPDLVPAAGACTVCPKRTGHQRDLFPSFDDTRHVGKGDRCLDPACFDQKQRVHLTRVKAELAAKAPAGKVLEISTDWNHAKPKPGAPIPAGQWHEVKKSDPKAMPAVVVDGHQSVGQVKYVSLERPKGSSGTGPDARYQAEERRRKLKMTRERTRRGRILAAVSAKVTGELTLPDLRLLAHAFVGEMQSDARRELCGALGLEPVHVKRPYGGNGPDYAKTLERHFDAAPRDALPKLLITLALAPELQIFAHSNDWKAPHLDAAAERYGVDVKAIDRELAAAAKAKAKPKGKTKAQTSATAGVKVVKTGKRAGDARRVRKVKAK